MKIRFTDALLDDIEERMISLEDVLNHYYIGKLSFETDEGIFEFAENKRLNSDEITLDSMYADSIDLFGLSGIVAIVDEHYKILEIIE